jgi:hypothetical protein
MKRLILVLLVSFGALGFSVLAGTADAQGKKGGGGPPDGLPPVNPPSDIPRPAHAPEPATLVLTGVGCAAVLSLTRRRKKGESEKA